MCDCMCVCVFAAGRMLQTSTGIRFINSLIATDLRLLVFPSHWERYGVAEEEEEEPGGSS